MSCIHNAIISKRESNCPQCRQPISIGDLLPKLDVKQIVDEIEISCPSKLKKREEEELPDKRQRVKVVEGPCTWKGTIQRAKDHEDVCGHTKIQCTNLGCEAVYQRMDEIYHNAVCLYRIVQCQHCEKKLYGKEFDDHKPCMYEKISCPNNCFDSTENITTLIRHELNSHLTVCQFELVHCPYRDAGCQEILPRHLMEVHSVNIPVHINGLLTTISSLKICERNLRQQVKDLRMQVQHLEKRDELICAKGDIMFPVSLDILRNEDPGGFHRMHSETSNIGGINFQVHLVFHPYLTYLKLSLQLSDGLSIFSQDVEIVVEYRTVVFSNNGVVDLELHGLHVHKFRYDNEEFFHNVNIYDVEKADYVKDRLFTLKTSVRVISFLDEYVFNL